ncbi:lipolytic protein G-D-S-L family [Pseudopedobacter saltans DSM 12145]|uniref:Lipolytic protein G-D-S-L family n=1 Tax=Pseudopedobacter saltans (strain ATCC 51119 / DSM 12145 / JCM 21818 / CCUG 39354 / LMG 10337 / NBRC 100064 / NCIMB 13643) TaxID=762903 RepID=F0SCP8_PSESL|nr:rhamnogalacturonan acetylesterase [Pseudopedobacter saltans]ADY53892.1 lipolytic protein G-D-S-L family [Pseudopedobacter saltans DSM 12145]
MKRISANRSVLLLLALVLMSFNTAQKKIKIYLVGDSTMAQKAKNKYPETGWGVPFTWFFNQNAEVDNRAQNGRSTQSFINEGRWKAILDSLKADDYVLVQFGHNDEVPTKKSATTPSQFQENLKRYVNETRAKKANPVLITPVARRKFDGGKVVDTHKEYAELVRNVARELNVPLIDLNERSLSLLQNFGEDKSKLLFLQLAERQNPNYPKGVEDNTHFSELGARYMAELVVQELKGIKSPLTSYIVGN